MKVPMKQNFLLPVSYLKELSNDEERRLLHIMCGYQCDKAFNKNDTREVI